MKTKLFSFIFALVASTSFLSAQSGIYNGQKWTLQDGTLTIENEDRCIFAEDLMTKESFEKFTIVNVKGDSTWIFSFQVKNNVTTVYGAKMAGYSDTDIRTYENEDWLISPAFDASKGAYITFDHARGPKSCMGVSLDNYTVWVTNDFEGDVTTANWTQIAIPKHGTVAWTYVNSGEMLIPQENCKPNCRIAWKYVCNANESASWEMKNVLVRVPEANGNTPPQSWDDYKASITKVIIQNGVIHVWSDAFSNCVNLNSLTIPNSVTNIGYNAFSGCTGLTSVTIPNSVTSIGSSAFSGCTGLTSITIPNGVTSIGNNAFYNCSSLTSITIPNSVTSIGNSAFSGCSSLTSITIPNSVTSIGNYAFYNCSSLTSVTIPNSVTSIGNYAFNNVPNIVYSGTATGAPWGARSLNGYVEENLVYRDATKTELLACSSAATGEITIPNDVTSIGNYAFRGCSSLTSITIPNSVTSIGSEAFSGCSSLEDIFVPCGELERFTQMFNDSYNSDYSDKLKIASSPHTLTIKDTKYGSVSVPDYNVCDESVMITAIPDSHCRFVKWSDGNTDNPRPVYLTEDITLEALFVYTLTDKCGKDYLLTWTLDTIKMAMDITGKGSLSDNYTYHTTFATLTIGNEVTTIGANAFSDCDNLQYLTLGSSVRVIESGAFACSDIKTITCYNKRPPTVNNDAFCNLDYETIIYVPKDYLENYQMHAFWGMFDVRPIGASGTETDKVKVEPAETTATVAWPTINGAGSYELVIRDKDGNALCTLVFNAQGQLTSIDFAAAPARDRSNVAAMAQGAGFAFTVTGLESGTMYKYSFITKNASGTVIDTKTGAFTTQSPTALEDIMDDASSASSSSVRKVLQNGQLYILRDGKVYNAVGAEVK